jgi:hypothetical protein
MKKGSTFPIRSYSITWRFLSLGTASQSRFGVYYSALTTVWVLLFLLMLHRLRYLGWRMRETHRLNSRLTYIACNAWANPATLLVGSTRAPINKSLFVTGVNRQPMDGCSLSFTMLVFGIYTRLVLRSGSRLTWLMGLAGRWYLYVLIQFGAVENINSVKWDPGEGVLTYLGPMLTWDRWTRIDSSWSMNHEADPVHLSPVSGL